MEKVDFLFIYEVKARELENLCLLKYELERRGYTVAFINTWYYLTKRPPNYKAKVVVTFALYDNYKFISSYIKKFNKVINMQWEQIGSLVNEKSHFLIKGNARNAVHICWSNKTKDRLIQRCGIDEKKLMVTGHISLDFLRKDFLIYYKTKEEIFNKYNIPLNKKVCLFISSFSLVELPDEILKSHPDLEYDLERFISFSKDSKKEIIKWITLILSKDKDIVFIYRAHPAEAEDKNLMELTYKYSNFFVINDLSVKQWIVICDIVYTWYSTSIAEIYISGKKCHILRPLPITKDRELVIYEKAIFVKDFSSFKSTLEENKSTFPVKEEVISQYYFRDKNEPTYKRICNSFIDVYKDDYFLLPKLSKNDRIPMKDKLKTYIYRSCINNTISFISDNIKLNIPLLKRRRQNKINGYYFYRDNMALKNYASKEEINKIVGKIRAVLEKK